MKPHQLNQLDNARGRLEVSNVESDLQRLRVRAGVRGHRDLGVTGRFAPSIDVTHHLVSTAGDCWRLLESEDQILLDLKCRPINRLGGGQ